MVYRVIDGKAVATPVATGPSNLTNTIIVDGLKEGEVVVVGPYKSLERLKDGDAVKAEESWGGGEGGGSGGGGGGGRGRGMRMRF
jgi:HlyD family secretion protein